MRTARLLIIVKIMLPLVLAALSGATTRAEVVPNSLFSDGAVLQQGMSVPVWGTANDGEKVTVSFQNQTISTIARNGRWMVRLKPLKSGGPFEMTISGENTVELKNILVGEVWLCSGQSNMWWPVDQTIDSQKAKAGSSDPMIRLFTVPLVRRVAAPLDDVHSRWLECGPQTVGGFSAVGYFFARDLRKVLGVPVGMINNAVCGSLAEEWTRRGVLQAHPELKAAVGGETGSLYNGMLSPIIPYAIKGVIWYQGESNAPRAFQYRTLFPVTICNWRNDWGQGDFPFLFVQIPPAPGKAEGEPSIWAELRESQLMTALCVPESAMTVVTEYGDQKDIHPKQKEPVGARLALAARAIAYGERIVHSGPIYKSMEIRGERVAISFDCIGGGLVAGGGELTGFRIAGEDRKFVKAQAQIEGDTVVVWSPEVPDPVAVRYGWADHPIINLFNKEGLPASPFRTDNFPVATGGK
ncbi:MAG: sialate O-acetylesterase [Armatimonadetes bacterium]|nr:sialate O-acetylesterase [Armatimonadota bacterium]